MCVAVDGCVCAWLIFTCDISSHLRADDCTSFSGAGMADGTEVLEGVSSLVHLSELGVSYTVYAPDMQQAEVVDHLSVSTLPTNLHHVCLRVACLIHRLCGDRARGWKVRLGMSWLSLRGG